MRTATAAVFENIESTEIVTEQPKALDIQCVVYVGDVLTMRQKRTAATRMGGKLFPVPDFLTVPKGVVVQCAITRLRTAYRGIHKAQIEEQQWPTWVQSYTLKNQWDAAIGQYRDIEVGISGASRDLLFKPITPEQEIGRIAGTRIGVVALTEECGIHSADDIKDAQMHYFPNWLEIASGSEIFPATLRELESHIAGRRAIAGSSELRSIGDAYLLSCSDFRDWGMSYLQYQTGVIKETDKVPGAARYDEIAERLFGVLEVTRQDELVKDFAKQSNDSQTVTAQLAEAIGRLTSLAEHNADVGQQSIQVADTAEPAPVTVKEAKAEMDAATADVDAFTDLSILDGNKGKNKGK